MRQAERRTQRRRWAMAALALGMTPFAGSAAAGEGAMALKLTSAAFAEGGAIPRKFTCQGEDISPPLSWFGVPREAKSLVLIVDDPDAPDPKAPKLTWVHWVLYNLPVTFAGDR